MLPYLNRRWIVESHLPRLTRIHAGLFALKPAFATTRPRHPSTSAFPVGIAKSIPRGQTDAPAPPLPSLCPARAVNRGHSSHRAGSFGWLVHLNLSVSALTGPGGAVSPPQLTLVPRRYYITCDRHRKLRRWPAILRWVRELTRPLHSFNDPETGSPLCATHCSAQVATLTPCGPAISPTGSILPCLAERITARQELIPAPSPSLHEGSVNIQFNLTVWNFELPLQPSELSIWSLWPPAEVIPITTLLSI